MKHFRWTLLEADQEKVSALMRAINVSEPIARALYHRGIFTYEDAKQFFCPSLEHLHSPFEMADMAKAARRLSDALDCGEKIMIYGDYDVDGTTGTSLLVLFLRELGADVMFYVNDRFKEGYGVSRSGIEYAHQQGVSLIISVDCGITAFEPAEYCKSLGIDFIICDHHESSDELPNAFAVLDPKQPGCNYLFKELSGCGVAFKLAEALCYVRGLDLNLARNYLDLVALAIAADIVDAVGENRVLLAAGIERTQINPRPALRALAKCAGLSLSNFTASSAVFTIAPRINAAGRLDHARQVIELLTTPNEEQIEHLALSLDELNTQRRSLDQLITEEAIEEASRLLLTYPSSIVLYKPDWHLGVVGIVASRVVEHFYVPTIILTESNGVLKGSARSVPGFNLYDAIAACKAHLIQFGGHAAAAGLSLSITSLENFRAAFEQVCAERLTFEQRIPEIRIDAELKLEQITPNFLKVLKRFEPCGPGNLHPVFLTRGLKQTCQARLLKEKHLKLNLATSQSQVYDAIGFNLHRYHDLVKDRSCTLDIVYSIEENTYNGNTTVQLRLRDLRASRS
ncbi:MAG: single-stranded-DNA-specific exonuclease RecJ [Candidatus Thermochlorobacter sp.]